MSVAIAMDAEIAVADDLPEGWIQTAMGDVADVIGGGTPKASDPSNFSKKGHAWITPADLSGYDRMYIGRGARDLSKKGLNSCSAKLMLRGAVLMSSRAPIGYVAVAENEACTNQGFRSFVCANGLAPEYVYYWLRFMRPVIEDMGSGSTFTEISGSKCKEIPLLLSPLAEQKRIVKKVEALLARVDTAREHLANALAILKRFRQAVLAAAYSGRLTEDWRKEHPGVSRADEIVEGIKPRKIHEVGEKKAKKVLDIYEYQEENGSDNLPPTWRYVALNKLVWSFDYGTSTKSKPTGKIPVLRMGNIQNGRIDWSDLVFTSDAKEIKKYLLKPGTVLFNRTNSPELVGKTAIYRGERPAIFAGYLIRVNNEPELDPEYLSCCLNTDYARDYCFTAKTDGVSQSNINAQKLGKFEVPFCSLEEQHEIIHRIDALFKLADAVEKHVTVATARADKLTQAVLAKAFRGELVPTEAELARREGRDYETAAQLLHRIKSERAAIIESKPPGAVSTAQ